MLKTPGIAKYIGGQTDGKVSACKRDVQSSKKPCLLLVIADKSLRFIVVCKMGLKLVP